ncbi:MarR family transcriptional regulator, partial [Corynebacterium bovis]
PRDGRGSYVVIEDLGLDLLAAAAPGHVADVRELLFAHLSEEELAQLDAITAKLQAQFTEA